MTDKQIKKEFKDNFLLQRKKLKEKKKNNKIWEEKIKTLENKIEEINNMPVEEWYASLGTELKMKLIRFHPLKTKDLLSVAVSSEETVATLNNLDADNDENNNVEESNSENENI